MTAHSSPSVPSPGHLGGAGPPSWRLVACPPSGAGPQYFRPIADEVDRRGGELWSVRYPGRESRLGEPLTYSVGDLVDELAPPLGRLLTDGLPTVLLGHSLGVGVAAHAAARLTQERPSVAAVIKLLVLSAREAPSTPTRRRDVHLRALAPHDDKLWNWLGSLGGIPPELLSDPDYRGMQLPILRADLLASLADDVLPGRGGVDRQSPWNPRPAPGQGCALTMPLLLTCGDEDSVVHLDDMAGWRELTTGEVHALTLRGGHHALLDDAPTLLDDIQTVVGLPRTAAAGLTQLNRP